MQMTNNQSLVAAFAAERCHLLLATAQAIYLCESTDTEMTFLTEYGRESMLRLFELYCGCRQARPEMTELDFTIPKLTALLKHFSAEVLLHKSTTHTLLGVYREASALMESMLDGKWLE